MLDQEKGPHSPFKRIAFSSFAVSIGAFTKLSYRRPATREPLSTLTTVILKKMVQRKTSNYFV